MSHDMELPQTIHDVPTPSFLVDIDKLNRNCQKMRNQCDGMGIGLRPHMKTHKTIEAGVLMTGGTKRKIVVSTVAEAEFFAAAGFDDVAYAVILEANKIPRCKKLAETLDFHVQIDSEKGVDLLGNHPLAGDRVWSVFLMIDCGYHGTGIPHDSDRVVHIARTIQASHLIKLKGLYTHDGSTYNAKTKSEVTDVVDTFSERLLAVWDRLREEGIQVQECTIGSTPGASLPGKLTNRMTEIHPGNYVFYDWQQSMIGSCELSEISCRVATRILGHYPDQNTMIVDCGFMGLSHCTLPNLTTYARIQDDENLELYNITQEIGRVRDKSGKLDFDKYPVGSMLLMYPFHSCATAALHPQYFVHSGEKIVAVWRPCRGW